MYHDFSSLCLPPPSSSVENDLGYLTVLHRRPVVVPGRVAELEGDLPAGGAVHPHLAEALGAVVRVDALQGRKCGNKWALVKNVVPVM